MAVVQLVPTVTWQEVRDRAALRQGTSLPDAAAVQAEATRLLGIALEDLADALEGAFRVMPLHKANECVLTIAKAYADRRRTPSSAQTTTPEDAAQRNVPRDPLAGVRHLLAGYTVGMA